MQAMKLHSRFWADYTSADIGAMDKDTLIAVLPVAAIEQHGPHLPLSVDTTLVNGVIESTIPKIPAAQNVLFLPTMQVGKSNEHERFPGTLTFSAQTLMTMWMELGACVARAGVKKLVFFNSHGGQMNLMDIVARDLRSKHDILVIAANWYTLGVPPGMFSADEMRHGIHAGDVESSMMLALTPQNVKMQHAQNFRSRTEDFARDYKYISITNTGKVGWQTQDLNAHGAAGDASKATAEKGRAVLDYVSDRFVELLDEVRRVPMSVLVDTPTLVR
jgi:creatinine amidohydrolase